MSGAHRLAVSELSEYAKDKKGEAYLSAVEAEFKENATEGSEADNKETSDKMIKVNNLGK